VPAGERQSTPGAASNRFGARVRSGPHAAAGAKKREQETPPPFPLGRRRRRPIAEVVAGAAFVLLARRGEPGAALEDSVVAYSLYQD
jgi:hypothetical protein